MLEEFDKELEHTDTRLRALTSRVQTAIRKSGGSCLQHKRNVMFITKSIYIHVGCNVCLGEYSCTEKPTSCDVREWNVNFLYVEVIAFLVVEPVRNVFLFFRN